MLKRLVGAQWLAIGVVSCISFAVNVFVARQMGPAAFGVYAQAVSLGAMLSIVIDGGFGKLLMRETVRPSLVLVAHRARLHGYAFGHAISLIVFLVLLASINPLALHWPTLLASIGFFGAVVLVNFSIAILRGQGRLMLDALWQMICRLLTALCVALVLWRGADAPWMILAAQFFGTVFFLLVLMWRGPVLPVFRVPGTVYAAALPLIWLDLATVIYFRADMFLFEVTGVPKADIGSYGAAFRLTEAILFLSTPVALLLFRRFRLNSATVVNTTLRQMTRFAACGVGVGLLVFALAQLPTAAFFRTLFGEGFSSSADLFRILSLMLVFALANGVLAQGVLALGLDRYYAWTATLAACVNISGNLLLMPRHGVCAAAWMTVVTEVVLTAGLSTALYAASKKGRYAE